MLLFRTELPAVNRHLNALGKPKTDRREKIHEKSSGCWFNFGGVMDITLLGTAIFPLCG
tara:strand:- start:313 stop:489 length:177 start_codon:yes stop_codon:yes gene_type:complete